MASEENPTFKIVSADQLSIINKENNVADLELINSSNNTTSEGSHDSNLIFGKKSQTTVNGQITTQTNPLGKISVSVGKSNNNADNKGQMIFSLNAGESSDHTNITEVLKLGPTETIYNNILPSQDGLSTKQVKLNANNGINTINNGLTPTVDDIFVNNILELGALGPNSIIQKRKITGYERFYKNC